MDPKTRYNQWINDPVVDAETKKELEDIKDNDNEIAERFHKDLEFGTGGLRGIMGAGTNRLNIYTIRKATQGLANYILANSDKNENAVAIAHDCRNNSELFTKEAALVLNANGIKTYVFDKLRPTPLLSYAVRELNCVAGIVITASHNPPEYNGYKAYWSDGGQVPYPRDEEIITDVSKVTEFSQIKTIPHEEAVQKGLYNIVQPSLDESYIKAVVGCCQHPDIIPGSDLNIVFTPLHGAGNESVCNALKQAGFKHYHVVPEQEKPDGNFPTVKSPNPENKNAFECAIKLANKVNADVIIATDPDADRVGVAVKDNGEYTFLNGNMTGVLLTDYLLSQMKTKGTLPKNPAVISTIVSTDMTKAIAAAYGAAYIDVLTGFKYIGEKIKEFESSDKHTYIFGFEESYGYLPGTYTRDKDAVAASLLVCEMAAYLKKQGKTLIDALNALYQKYGYYNESIENLYYEGIEGQEKINKIMNFLRKNPPKNFGESKVVETRDYLNKTVTTSDGKTEATTLPVSDVLYYAMEDGSWACVRPSGTEPKIKIYFGVVISNATDISQTKDKLAGLWESMKKSVDSALS